MAKLTNDEVRVIHSFLPSTNRYFLEYQLQQVLCIDLQRPDVTSSRIHLSPETAVVIEREAASGLTRALTVRHGWWVIRDNTITPANPYVAGSWYQEKRISCWDIEDHTAHKTADDILKGCVTMANHYTTWGYHSAPLDVEAHGLYAIPTLKWLQDAAHC